MFLKKWLKGRINEKGEEIANGKPLVLPTRLNRPLSLQEQMQRVMLHMSQQAASQGLETEEEADDFEVGDEKEFVSPYEFKEMVQEVPLDQEKPAGLIEEKSQQKEEKVEKNDEA
jgi:hypothetical protein